MKYEIIYDCDDEKNIRETICCESWYELQEKIKRMKMAGCYHIDAACVDEEEW